MYVLHDRPVVHLLAANLNADVFKFVVAFIILNLDIYIIGLSHEYANYIDHGFRAEMSAWLSY